MSTARQARILQVGLMAFALLLAAASADAASRFPTKPEDVLIVDCLLPGQVRKIGRVRAFLTPRQPAKLSQFECELRGGEYVEYDRADLGTALATWSAKAAEGDPVAMVYVGEAYAKGFGGAPDYASAGLWFERAAALGSTRAKQNLGHLYELGLGRASDLEKALNLYREAAGVESGELVFATDLAALREDVTTARQALHQALQREQGLLRSIDGLKVEIESLRQRLIREKAEAGARASAEMTAMWLVLEEEIQSKEQALIEANKRMLSMLPEQRRLDRIRTDGPFELSFEQPFLVASRSEPLALVSGSLERTELRGRVQPAPLVGELWINGQATDVDSEGRFVLTLGQAPADGMVQIRVVDGSGEASQSQMRLVGLAEAVTAQSRPAPPWQERSWPPGVGVPTQKALLIGNTDYRNLDPLSTPSADVQALAALLRTRMGMRVSVMENSTRTDLLLGLHQFLSEIEDDQDALIYYAGHGVIDASGEGAWVPIDGRRDDKDSLLSNRIVSEMLEAAKARHVLVVADSCYAGTLSGNALPLVSETLPESAWRAWFDQSSKQRSRLVMTSGGLSPVPDRIDGRHSAFAQALIAVISRAEGAVESQRLLREIRRQLPEDPLSAALGVEATLAPIEFSGHQAGELVLRAGG